MDHPVDTEEEANPPHKRPNIGVLGCGSGGCNMANALTTGATGLRTIALDSNAEHLKRLSTDLKILLTPQTRKEKSSDSILDHGIYAVWGSKKEVLRVLNGLDVLFLLVGLGGATGTGSSVEVARMAKKKGLPVIGLLSLPFAVESNSRTEVAQLGLKHLLEELDLAIVLPNDVLLELAPELPMAQAFSVMDELLAHPVTCFSTILIKNDIGPMLDFFSGSRLATLGLGSSIGKRKFEMATQEALHLPYLRDSPIQKGLFFAKMGPNEFIEDVEIVMDEVFKRHPEIQMLHRVIVEDTYSNRVDIILIAATNI